MRMVTLAFEVQDGVHDVLERFRAGQASLFRHVADEEGRHVPALGAEQQLGRGLADLADAARRRLELQREHGLNRVDDDEGRLDPIDLLENAFEARFRQQIQRRRSDAKPLAA